MVDRHHPGLAPTALLQKLAGGLCMTSADLAEALDLTNRQVCDAAAGLLRRGYLERMAVGCYQLTTAGHAAAARGEKIKSGPRGPRNRVQVYKDTLQQRAWTAMRNQNVFCIADIALVAARPADGKPEASIRSYLNLLSGVGYVEVSTRRIPGAAPTSNGHQLYRLAKNTGPRAPAKLTKARGIHDFNIAGDVLCSPR